MIVAGANADTPVGRVRGTVRTHRSKWRSTIGATVLLLVLAGCQDASPAATSPYTKPGQQVLLSDGRRINLVCRGRGSPTVIMEAGFGAGAFAWARTQPTLARTTRVCAYDRAGYGFSDPGPLPRDGAAIARDLDEALEVARIEGPYIFVGHSAGGLYARLFAARRLGEVAGLVLLDPTVEQRAPSGRDGLDGIRRRLQRCLAASLTKSQPPSDERGQRECVSSNGGDRARVIAQRPDTWRNRLSELDEIFGRTSEQVMRTGDLLAEVPTYVLTASESASSSATIGYADPKSIWELQHVRLALSFRHGFQRTLLSSHLMQNDRPEVVAEAVRAMVVAARAGTPPEPLAPSETAQPAGEAAFPEAPR